jgi:hypothetical protein
MATKGVLSLAILLLISCHSCHSFLSLAILLLLPCQSYHGLPAQAILLLLSCHGYQGCPVPGNYDAAFLSTLLQAKLFVFTLAPVLIKLMIRLWQQLKHSELAYLTEK